MLRRNFLRALGTTAAVAAGSVTSLGCKSKAQKQAELAVPDIARLEKLLAERHVTSLARALPPAGEQLGAKYGDKVIVPTEGPAIGPLFLEILNKTDDLRSAKRSYYAILDLGGEIVWVDDPNWLVIGRKAGVAFGKLEAILAGKEKYAAGAGRYGGADPEALTLFEAAPIVNNGKTIGGLLSAWEIHEAAEDMQRQLQTELAMKTVKPKTRAKAKDKYQLALDTPDLWVACFNEKYVYLQEGAPQTLEDGAKSIGLFAKTVNGQYTGTFDVLNRGWGVSAKRVPSLGEGMGIAVLRHDP